MLSGVEDSDAPRTHEEVGTANIVKEDTKPKPRKLAGRLQWGQKFVSAIADQGLYAGTNFIVNVLLARWLPGENYGAFVVAYAWYLLLHNLYESVLIEPMMFYGAGKYGRKLQKYIGYVLYGHVGFSLLMLCLLGIGAIFAYFYDSELMAWAIAGAALAAPLNSMLWLSRRPFYIMAKPHWSAIGGAIYMAVLIPWIVLLNIQGALNAFNAMIAMSLAGLPSIIFLFYILKVDWRPNDPEITGREVVRDHWSFGKWSVTSRILQWFPSNVFYVILPTMVGLQGSAALRALSNLTLPILMAQQAVIVVLLPTFVRTYRNKGRKELNRRIWAAIALQFVPTFGYFIVLLLFGVKLMSFIYDSKFDDIIDLPNIAAIGIMPVLMSINLVLSTGLRAMGWIKLTSISRIVPTIFTVTIGIMLVAGYGVLGANVSSALSSILSFAILLWFYRRQMDSEEESPLNTEIGDRP